MNPDVAAPTGFALDRTITVPGTAASISLSGETAADILIGIEQGNRFPEGALSIGQMAFAVKTKEDVVFDAGETKVSFGASADARFEAGIFTTSADAVAALRLPDTPDFNLDLPAGDTERFLVLLTAYQVVGHVRATHPLGVLGSVSFGVDAARASSFAVVHRFDSTEADNARAVIADAVGSWRLPRHVELDAAGELNLKPATWLVAEADASLAIKLAAQLGYDVTFTREAKLIGLTRDLGVKIDAALKATLGFSVAGRYVMVVGREDSRLHPERRVRLRLYKTSKKGLSFGLNLDVGLTPSQVLPDDPGDLVQAVFGQHGLQVLKDIEQWADPRTPIATNVARLANDTGLALLRRVTDVDPAVAFDKARGVVFDALQQWDALPDRVSALLWRLIDAGAAEGAVSELKDFLRALADPDPGTRGEALSTAIARNLFADSPTAQWLQAVADRGLLALPLDDASRIASKTLAVLDGDVVRKLHAFIDEKLDLETIRRGDFETVDAWLVARLADFLDKTALGAPELKEIQMAIVALEGKVRDIYAVGIQAATKRYSAELASTYQRTTTDTALLDVTFDLGSVAARAMFRDVVGGRLDDLLMTSTDGVSIGTAILSHEIPRKSDVAVHLPFGMFEGTHVNDAVAQLTVEEHAGRVLVYDFKGEDTITKNQYLSDLSLFGKVRVVDGRLMLDDRGMLAYESLQVQPSMRLKDLEARTAPFIRTYFPQMFGGGDSALSTFFADLDATIGGSSNRLGDVALAMQVSYPAGILGSWCRERTDAELKAGAAAISRRLQATIRPLLADAFFQDLDNLGENAVAAPLMVWSCLPVTTSVDFDGTGIGRFDTDSDPFWDFPSVALRRAMVGHALTVAKLALALDNAKGRLSEAGNRNAAFFGHERVGRFMSLALDNQEGSLRLNGLLFMEAEIIEGAARALKAISRASRDISRAPVRAIEEMTRFASTLTEAFSRRFANSYRTGALRTLGPLVLAECSAALSSGQAANASAMLRMYMFNEDRSFALDRFLKNELPPAAAVRLTQTLITPQGRA